MARLSVLLVLLSNVWLLKCQDEVSAFEEEEPDNVDSHDNPAYSFSYGVSDARTGDIKSVWEAKNGDTVKGHYSVLEPTGSMRTVEYSAGPKSGFQAIVKNDPIIEPKPLHDPTILQDKSMRDYEKLYDFSESANDEDDSYMVNRKKKPKYPFEGFKDYSEKKKPKYPADLESSDYTHSITIKHPRDSILDGSEAHSHSGFNFDPNCKTKHKKENLYSNVVELDLIKNKFPQNPIFSSDFYNDDLGRYGQYSNFDSEKISPYSDSQYKIPKGTNKYKGSHPLFDSDHYPQLFPDIPPEKYYPDDLPPRPKKKRPHRDPEFHYPSDDLDDYVLVPKKKLKQQHKKPPRDEYLSESDDFERPNRHPYNDDEDEDRYRPPRGNNGPKEVVRKIIKKRKPVINLLDIFDI